MCSSVECLSDSELRLAWRTYNAGRCYLVRSPLLFKCILILLNSKYFLSARMEFDLKKEKKIWKTKQVSESSLCNQWTQIKSQFEDFCFLWNWYIVRGSCCTSEINKMFYVPYSWWGIKGSLAAPLSYKTKVFSDTLGFIKASLSLSCLSIIVQKERRCLMKPLHIWQCSLWNVSWNRASWWN